VTPKRTHPTPEEWTAWIRDPRGAPDAPAREEHLATCATCRSLVDTLRLVEHARGVETWENAPEDLVQRVLDRPDDPSLDAPREFDAVEWRPLDVRGGSPAAVGSARTASRVFDAGEVGIVATPPASDGLWHIQGRVWLRDDQRAVIRVVLVHDDHVIASIATTPGRDFELSEAVGSGWSLEIHLPGEDVLVLEEPSP
jgi:hypothetical protein